ncbi:MAG TPA: PAS domain S-box protein, partial [archaeon]|nr:PAS domain S-box protein [archaeon]
MYYTLSTDDKIVINNERLNVVNIVIPKDIIHKWQKFANLLAEFIQIPAALIMKLNPPYIEVFTSSKTNENPYKVGEKEYFDKSGLYCEHVIKTRNKLLVSNAIKEEYWNKNPDIKLGMISYLGFPLFWPDGEAFGTICVLDLKENHYNENQNSLLEEFKHIIETHLSLLYENCKRDNIIKDYMESEEMLRDNLRRLEDIQHLGKIGYWEFDVNNQQIIWSDQVFRLYERNPSQGPPSAEEEAAYYTPDESKRLRDYAQRAFEDGEKFEYDFQANLPSGKVILLTALMRPIKDRSGHIIKLAGIVQDITDRKLTELKLRESEERYQKAYERAIFYRDLFTHDISNIFNNLNLSSEFISMAQNNYDKLDDLDEVFSVIQNSVERGSLLISNVQKLSQLEDSEVKLQSMDIIKELEESITFLRNSFPNKEFVLEINNPYNKVLV